MDFFTVLVALISAFVVKDVTAQFTTQYPTTCPECPIPTEPYCPTTWYPVTCPTCTCPTERPCPTTWYPTTCPDCPTPTQCPTYQPPSTPSTTTIVAPVTTTPPTFTKTYYTTSVPSWPTSGTRVHPGIAASTPEADLLVFSLVDPPSFIQLVNEDLLFTNDVTEGAYVGPNNVLAVEVQATVYTDDRRSSRSVILVVFPRPTKSDDEVLEPMEIKN